MAVVWHPISANVCQAGGAMTVPVNVPQECGGHSVTSPAAAATIARVIPRVGNVLALRVCSPRTAFSPVPLATMALPASSAASATGQAAIPRLEPASALQRELGPAVTCPVPRALLASSAPVPILAKMEVSSKPHRAPAAALLAGWAPSAPCPAQRAFMDPAAPRNVAATTAASVTDSLGSAAALRVTLGIGAGRSARWAALGRTVLRRATALRTPVASRPMAHVCANTASLGTAAPSASAPTASTVSAARPPAPATRSTASAATR